MAGILTLLCLENDHQYMMYSEAEKEALENTIQQLHQGLHFCKELQEEWQQYGEAGFECGIIEEWDADDQIKDESIEEWLHILENVEYLGEITKEGGKA